MDLTYSEAYQTFRNEVREFLTNNWDKSKARDKEFQTKFRRLATEKGYLNRGIPKQYGGSEQAPDVLKGHIIKEEFSRARAVTEVTGIGMMMVVPTLIEVGEQWQKDKFVEKTVTGEIKWAQGYSEPGSGSDLASLKTKGELVGDEWVINGQKIWTTNADTADYMFALVRTEPEAGKHAGISYLLFDFKQSGVTVRPLKQISGGREFCEVFLDDVRTPAHWIVGERGEGWKTSKVNLKHERNSMGGATANMSLFNKLVKLAKSRTLNGKPAIENAAIRERLAKIDGYIQAQVYSGFYQLTRDANAKPTGNLSMVGKLYSSNIGKEIAELVTDIIGDDLMKMPDLKNWADIGDEKWVNQIFGSMGMAIAGGTSNIQRNIIAERGLELPREAAE